MPKLSELLSADKFVDALAWLQQNKITSTDDTKECLDLILSYSLSNENINALLLSSSFLRLSGVSEALSSDAKYVTLLNFIASKQMNISIDDSIITDDLKKIFKLVGNKDFAKKAMGHALDKKSESMARGIFSIMRSYGGFHADNKLQLQAQMKGYSGFFQGPNFERKWSFATNISKTPTVRPEDWAAANKIFNALKAEHGEREFSVKISRKDPKYSIYNLQRSFVITHKKLANGNFEKGVYALARGSADINNDINEGILGHGSSAMVKLAVSETGETKIYRAGKLSKSSDQSELFERTGTVPIHSPSTRNTLWIHDRYIQKDRELQTLQEGITLNNYLNKASPVSEVDCINIIGLLAHELQSLHDTGWVHHDISGNNFMIKINQDNNVESARLIDFDAAAKIDGNHSLKDDLPYFIILVHTLTQCSSLKENKALMDWLNPLATKCYPHIGLPTVGLGEKIQGLPSTLNDFLDTLKRKVTPHDQLRV